MPKLCQIIAVESSVKTRVYKEVTESHKALQKHDLFSGHVRRYKPRDEDPMSPMGERLPDDTRKVQADAEQIIADTAKQLTELFDVAATREYGNQTAKADVVVEGKPLLTGVPVTYLLFLEKQLEDMNTFVSKLPTLDSAESWNWNEAQAMFASATSGTARSKKVVRPMVMYDATKEHPAQVKEVTEDLFAGTWETTKFSAALTTTRRNELLQRVVTLQKAVKFAREQANSQDVSEVKVGKAVFDFLFHK